MDPVDCLRKQVPKTKIIISGVLYWRNKSQHFLYKESTELDMLCSGLDCLTVDGNCWIGKFGTARDGIHLNRSRAQKFWDLLCKIIHSCFQGNVETERCKWLR
jgi:hypothetical protein